MRAEYDFSQAKRNPYAKKLKRTITLRVDTSAIEYFQQLSSETGIPYQTLMNLYLRDCKERNKKITLAWTSAPKNRS
jgi:predicted DNA binding CopG/RHH family protein